MKFRFERLFPALLFSLFVFGGCASANGDDSAVQEKTFASKNAHSEFNSVQITVPEGAEYLVVNSHTPKEIEVKKYSSVTKTVEEKNLLPDDLTIACVNCGQFDYGDGATSAPLFARRRK